MLGKFSYLSSADIVVQNQFIEKFFENNIRMSNSLDPHQAYFYHSVGPYLGPNYFQSLSADKTMRQLNIILY